MDAVFHSGLGGVGEFAGAAGKFFPGLPVDVAFHVILEGKITQIFLGKGDCGTADRGADGKDSSSDETAFPENGKP